MISLSPAVGRSQLDIHDIRSAGNPLVRWSAYRGLFYCLLARNLKLRFGGIRHLSWVGIFLTHFNPIVVVAVYTFVCGGIMKLRVPNYVVFLAVGHLHWTLFTTILSRACSSVYRNSGIIKQVRFPYIMLSLADVADQVLEFLTVLMLLFLLLPLLGGKYVGLMVLYPLVFLLQVVFMTGLAAGFSALQGVFHDVGKAQALALRLMFWFTPVIYSPEMVPAGFRQIFTFLNPMALFLNSYRDLLCYQRIPGALEWLGMGAWAAVAVLLGFSLFGRLERHLPEAF